MDAEEGGPIREVALRGGPFDGRTVWWSGGPYLDVPSIDGLTIWDPDQPRSEDVELVWRDVPYRQSTENPLVFDFAGG